MILNDMIVQIQLHLDQTKKHIADLESGTKASSPKCRAELQKIKVLAHQLRKECITTQKALPVKTRVKITPTEVPVAEPVLPPEPEAPVVAPKKPKRRTK